MLLTRKLGLSWLIKDTVQKHCENKDLVYVSSVEFNELIQVEQRGKLLLLDGIMAPIFLVPYTFVSTYRYQGQLVAKQ